MNIFSGLANPIRSIFIVLVFLSLFIPVTAFSQTTDKTLRIYLDCSGEMQRGDIMKTTAAVLAAELPKFYESKEIPNRLLILVDAFCIKSGQPLIESRFDFRIGQQNTAPYTNLRDFQAPSMWADAESDINSLVNRAAWTGDVKNSNTILVILTNSRKSLDPDDVITINNTADKIGSKIIQIILPRPNDDSTDEALGIILNKTISKLLQTIKLEMQKVVAKFAAVPVDLKVTFKNNSENATIFAWDFGNGEKSDQQSPSAVTYRKPGYYHVSLTASNGVKTEKFSLTVTVSSKTSEVKAKFEVQPDSGPVPLIVNITNLSQNTNKCEWDFGNGENSAETSPSPVSYLTPGNFTITLTVTDENGKKDSCSMDINALEARKTAKALFESKTSSKTAPSTVSFTDKSENALKLKWDFGDIQSKDNFSEERNPKHTYKTHGDFKVTLKATGADGKESEVSRTINVTKREEIAPQVVKKTPVSIFSADTVKGKAPLEVKFQNNSENATSFQWDFADGKRSNEKSPKHLFEKAGKYKVKLTAAEDTDTDTAYKEITVGEKESTKIPLIIFLLMIVSAAGYFLFRFIFPPKTLNVIYKKNNQATENSPKKIQKSISMAAVFGCEKNFKIFMCLDTESDEMKIQFLSLDDKPITLQSALDPNRTVALQKDTMTSPARLGEYKILGTNDSFEVTMHSEEA